MAAAAAAAAETAVAAGHHAHSRGRWSQLSSSTRGQRAQQSHSQLGGMIPQAKQPGNESTASAASLAPTRSFLAGKSSASRWVYPKSVNSRATLAMPSPSTCSHAGRAVWTGRTAYGGSPNRACAAPPHERWPTQGACADSERIEGWHAGAAGMRPQAAKSCMRGVLQGGAVAAGPRSRAGRLAAGAHPKGAEGQVVKADEGLRVALLQAVDCGLRGGRALCIHSNKGGRAVTMQRKRRAGQREGLSAETAPCAVYKATGQAGQGTGRRQDTGDRLDAEQDVHRACF